MQEDPEPVLEDQNQIEEKLSLSKAKKERQEAEEQAKMLANRITLLRQEEAKALKKIEDTRQRAREIMEARIRNQEKERRREEERKAREREEELKAESNRLAKEESKQSKENHKASIMQKLRSDVEAVKREKASNQDLIRQKKVETIEVNTSRAQHLKNMSKDAKTRREEEAEEKKIAARQELERRVAEELRIRQEKQDEVVRMEQEELDLIHRLQNTQMMQKTAIEELETLLSTNGDVTASKLLSGDPSPTVTPSKRRASKPSTPSKSQ